VATFQLPDRLGFANAKAALAEGLSAIAAGQREFDLSRVTAVDSSAVALVLAWKRAARARGVELEVVNAPDSLRSLAQLYGVARLL
jgi:phospholipid transport system transporter-binding protein